MICATALASVYETLAWPRKTGHCCWGTPVQGMPQHYATATLERLLDAANSVRQTRDRTMVLRVVSPEMETKWK